MSNYLQNRPQKLQEKVFGKLFESAEIANFTMKERDAYEESLKHYRDIKNVVDSSIQDGRIEGRIEGKIEGKIEVKIQIAKKGLEENLPMDLIIRLTGLTEDEINKIK